MNTDEVENGDDDQVTEHGTRHHDGTGPRADDITDAQQFGSSVPGEGSRFVDVSNRNLHSLNQQPHSFGDEFLDESEPETNKNGRPSGASLFPRNKDLGGGDSFRIEQRAG